VAPRGRKSGSPVVFGPRTLGRTWGTRPGDQACGWTANASRFLPKITPLEPRSINEYLCDALHQTHGDPCLTFLCAELVKYAEDLRPSRAFGDRWIRANRTAVLRVPSVITTGRENRLRKNAGPGRKHVPQGLKPNVFSILYGPTKVVP
jgi:hypothetical protein